MRRRQSKRQRPKLTLPETQQSELSPPSSNKRAVTQGLKQIVIKFDQLNSGDSLSEKVLGLKTGSVPQGRKVIITGFVLNSYITKSREVNVGGYFVLCKPPSISKEFWD